MRASVPGARVSDPMRYPSDELTDAERARLAPHFTSLDGPVFALVNLPETVKGALFARYSDALPIMRACVDESFPRADGESDAARRRAVNAKAYDLLRGLLPAASLSHMGIYATGQAYEQLILHLLGHPLPEARRYGGLILD